MPLQLPPCGAQTLGCRLSPLQGSNQWGLSVQPRKTRPSLSSQSQPCPAAVKGRTGHEGWSDAMGYRRSPEVQGHGLGRGRKVPTKCQLHSAWRTAGLSLQRLRSCLPAVCFGITCTLGHVYVHTCTDPSRVLVLLTSPPNRL